MNADFFIRQTGLVDPSILTMPITIIGAGGIGSWTTLALSKMGCQNITVYDGDEVEIQNVGSQIYTSTQIGLKKVVALKEHMMTHSETYPEVISNHWDENTVIQEGILIAAVDSMDVRRRLYEAHRFQRIWFIDGRMAANEIHLFVFRLDDEAALKEYEMTLFSDDEADPVPCTERAVMYNTFVCGGLISSLVARIANRQPVKFETIVDLLNFTMF